MRTNPEEFIRKRLMEPESLRDAKRHEMVHPGRNMHHAAGLQPEWKESAVLMLLWENAGNWFTVLMERTQNGSVHSGQISFPGGKIESEDANARAAALRETQEEIGIIPEDVEILGSLLPVYIPVSRFSVQPFLGMMQTVPTFLPNRNEVHQIIEVPLRELWNKNSREIRELDLGVRGKIRVPGYVWKEHFIWGATAIMLREAEYLLTLK